MITNPKDFFEQVKNLCEEQALRFVDVLRRIDDVDTNTSTVKAELKAAINNKLDKADNAVSASKWQTPRKLKLSGDVTGEASVDGSGDVTVTTAVADDSHNHVIGNIDGLQSALSTKLSVTDYNDDKSAFALKEQSYTKDEVDAKVGAVYRPKGSVTNYEALPTTNNMVGDVYNLLDTGANYVWTDSGWDKLSETVDLTPYLTSANAASTYATNTALAQVKNTADAAFPKASLTYGTSDKTAGSSSLATGSIYLMYE